MSERKPTHPTAPEPTERCAYNLPEPPPGVQPLTEENQHDRTVLKWSGGRPVPTVGARVRVMINSLGLGSVVNYFRESGYLGVMVKLDAPPDWHVKQTAGEWHAGHALVFGAEIRPVEGADAKS